ncbi:hypothetical protein HX014_09960 [Myroides marinus]|uniref:hypothetical protein n=1 Tax=Myroides marinus TaxID=703342 RepID=UPI002574C9C5|nr:hypothetical protein [Myroides marinus]MDM1350927.1 hypothetical protein [Myroides marinus]MDM1358134.1 hypothetical protein [Myroides marinus]
MKNNKSIYSLLKSKGIVFPTTPEEIEQFELYNDIDNCELPFKNNPLEILAIGYKKPVVKSTISQSLTEEVDSLKMVARKGNKLSDSLIEKMKANQRKK